MDPSLPTRSPNHGEMDQRERGRACRMGFIPGGGGRRRNLRIGSAGGVWAWADRSVRRGVKYQGVKKKMKKGQAGSNGCICREASVTARHWWIGRAMVGVGGRQDRTDWGKNRVWFRHSIGGPAIRNNGDRGRGQKVAKRIDTNSEPLEGKKCVMSEGHMRRGRVNVGGGERIEGGRREKAQDMAWRNKDAAWVEVGIEPPHARGKGQIWRSQWTRVWERQSRSLSLSLSKLLLDGGCNRWEREGRRQESAK